MDSRRTPQHSRPSPGCRHEILEKKLFWSLALTALIFLVELGGGFWTRSLALISDSWHVFADAAALGLSWFALRQARRPPTFRHTFGFSRLEVIAAFVNGLSLLFISLWIIVEAVQRLFAPVAVKGLEMFVVAVVGMLVNLIIGLVLKGHAHENLNIKSAFLHVVGDALSSAGVVAAGILVLRRQWYAADPAISVVISLFIMKSAFGLLKESFHILMEGAPGGLQLGGVVSALLRLPGVVNVHDLHAWTISGRFVALSMHVLVAPGGPDCQEVLVRCQRLLAEEFGVFHATIQVETCCPFQEGDQECALFCETGSPERNRAPHKP